MFASTVLYDFVVQFIEEGFPQLSEMSFGIWAALTIWLANYSWGFLTEWYWYEFKLLQGIRCILEWSFAMFGNLVWPPCLGVATIMWFHNYTNMPLDFGTAVSLVVGVGGLLWNFFYPQRKLEKIAGGNYSY